MKQFFLHLFAISLAASLFVACSPENGSPNLQGDKVKAVLRFNVLGISDDGGDAESITRAQGEGNQVIASTTTALDNNLFMTTTLEEVPASKTRALESLNSGAKYRLVVYDNTGTYVGHQDYSLGDVSSFISINASIGDTYSLVAYSYNSSTLPSVDTSSSLSAAKLTAVPAGTDLLYWSGTITISAVDNQKDFDFKRKLSRVNVSVDASSSNVNKNITSLGTITFSPSYKADLSFDNTNTGSLSKNGSSTPITIAAGTISGMTMTGGTRSIVYTAGETMTVNLSNVVLASTIYGSRSATFNTALVSGKQYTLKVVFKGLDDVPTSPEEFPWTFDGRHCFDIAYTEGTAANGNGRLVWRQNYKTDFSLTNENDGHSVARGTTYSGRQIYTFKPAAAVNNVRFAYVDATGEIVNSITPKADYSGTVPANTECKVLVNYKSSLNTYLRGRTNLTAIKYDLYVIYSYFGTDYKFKISPRFQDGACCGAHTVSTKNEWQLYMCHNVGATETSDPFTPTSALCGNYYRWGRNEVVADASTPATAIAGWSGAAYGPYDGWQDAVKTAADPCPTGWRIPTHAQMRAMSTVLNSNTIEAYNFIAPVDEGVENYWSALAILGYDLPLPAVGYRDLDNGRLMQRGAASFIWTSTRYNAQNAHYFSLSSTAADGRYQVASTYGQVIRCVSQ